MAQCFTGRSAVRAARQLGATCVSGARCMLHPPASALHPAASAYSRCSACDSHPPTRHSAGGTAGETDVAQRSSSSTKSLAVLLNFRMLHFSVLPVALCANPAGARRRNAACWKLHAACVLGFCNSPRWARTEVASIAARSGPSARRPRDCPRHIRQRYGTNAVRPMCLQCWLHSQPSYVRGVCLVGCI